MSEDDGFEPFINLTEEELVYWEDRLPDEILRPIVECCHFLDFAAAMRALSTEDREALASLVRERLYCFTHELEALYRHPARDGLLKRAEALRASTPSCWTDACVATELLLARIARERA
jgi:hypothetical protein